MQAAIVALLSLGGKKPHSRPLYSSSFFLFLFYFDPANMPAAAGTTATSTKQPIGKSTASSAAST